ncbi:MAG TPA: DUF1003 domain-containing protein [Parcubacteria group bacterium]|nr:DUF1003 domain-containing protein [Parcubacteria group bacterium]
MEIKHTLPDLEQIIRARHPLKNSFVKTQETLSSAERFAVYVTHHVGSFRFFTILLIWSFLWLAWNLFGPVELRFDPAPAFVIWLFLSNIIQLILLPLILIGQNLENRHTNMQAEEDYQVSKHSEEEIKIIIGHLENQNELMLEIMRKLDRN